MCVRANKHLVLSPKLRNSVRAVAREAIRIVKGLRGTQKDPRAPDGQGRGLWGWFSLASEPPIRFALLVGVPAVESPHRALGISLVPNLLLYAILRPLFFQNTRKKKMEWQELQPTLASHDECDVTGRRPRATSSCAECRRRRIRCDGLATPCRQCVYYEVPHLCHYPLRKPRRNVSWRYGGRTCISRRHRRAVTNASSYCRSYTELYEAHAKSQKILGALFPSASIDSLAAMSRGQLVEKAQAALQSSAPPPAPEEGALDHIRSLEPSPECNFTWDEVSGDDDDGRESRVADDVNGLALSLEPLRASYLGFTSVPTILRVIARVSPRVRQVVPMSPTTWRGPEQVAGRPECSDSSKVDELSLVNAYFSQIHLITPMVDEMDFRQRYSKAGVSGDQDSSWLALANMVLAMGCFVSDATRFSGNNIFYKRALSHLNISSFGSGHLYTVQALAMLGLLR